MYKSAHGGHKCQMELQVVCEADMSVGNYWILHKNSMHA